MIKIKGLFSLFLITAALYLSSTTLLAGEKCKPTPTPTLQPTPATEPSPTLQPSPSPTPTPTTALSPTPTTLPTIEPTSTPTPIPTSKPQGDTGGGNGGGQAPVCPAQSPGTIKLLSAVPEGSGKIKLKWTIAPSATHYSVFYGLDSQNYVYGIPNTGNVDQITVSSLETGKKYCFATSAVNDCQNGPLSNEICLTTGPQGGVVFEGQGEVLGLSATGSKTNIKLLLSIILGFTGLKLIKKYVSGR